MSPAGEGYAVASGRFMLLLPCFYIAGFGGPIGQH